MEKKSRTARSFRYARKTANGVAFLVQPRSRKRKCEEFGTQHDASREGRKRKCRRLLEESERRQLLLLQVNQLGQSSGNDALTSNGELGGAEEQPTAKDGKCTAAATFARPRCYPHSFLIVDRSCESAAEAERQGEVRQMLPSASTRRQACSAGRISLGFARSKQPERSRQQHRQQARSRHQRELNVQQFSPCLQGHTKPDGSVFDRSGVMVTTRTGNLGLNISAVKAAKRQPSRNGAEGEGAIAAFARGECLSAIVASQKCTEDTSADKTHGKAARNTQVLTQCYTGAVVGGPLAAAVIHDAVVDTSSARRQPSLDDPALTESEEEKQRYRKGRQHQKKRSRAWHNRQVREAEDDSGQRRISQIHCQESTEEQPKGKTVVQQLTEQRLLEFRLQWRREKQQGSKTPHQPHADALKRSRVEVRHQNNNRERGEDVHRTQRSAFPRFGDIQKADSKSPRTANVAGQQPPQQRSLRKRQREEHHLQKRPQQRGCKTRRAYTDVPAFCQPSNNFAVQRGKGKKTCSAVRSPFKVQLRRSVRLANVHSVVGVRKPNIRLSGQPQCKSPQKEDIEELSRRQDYQQRIRLEQPRDLERPHRKLQQYLQVGKKQLQRPYQVWRRTQEWHLVRGANCTLSAWSGCDEDLNLSSEQFQGRGGREQTLPQPQQTADCETGAGGSCVEGPEAEQLKKSASVNKMRNKAVKADWIYLSETTETSPLRTLRCVDEAYQTGQLNVIDWLGLRLERLLHWDEDVENYEELKAGEWKNVLSGFPARLRRAGLIRRCSPAMPSSFGASEGVREEVNSSARYPVIASLASLQNYHHGTEEERSGREKCDHVMSAGRFFAAVEGASAVVVEGKQEAGRTAEYTQPSEAGKSYSTFATEQQPSIKGALDPAEKLSTLRAAAALPGSRSRGSCRIGEQLEALRFLGITQQARQLSSLTCHQGWKSCLHERQEQQQQATPHAQPQRGQQHGQSAQRNLRQRRGVMNVRESSRLRNRICHARRGKQLFQDELSLLHRALFLFHLDSSAGSLSKEKFTLVDPARSPYLQSKRRLQLLEASNDILIRGDGTTCCGEDASLKSTAHAAAKDAVERGAAVAVCKALAKEGVVLTHLAPSLLPELSRQKSWRQQGTAEEAAVNRWWERLGWTVYILRGSAERDSATQGQASRVTYAGGGTRGQADVPPLRSSTLLADTKRGNAAEEPTSAAACVPRASPPQDEFNLSCASVTGSFSLQTWKEVTFGGQLEGRGHKERSVSVRAKRLSLTEPGVFGAFPRKAEFSDSANAGDSWTSTRGETHRHALPRNASAVQFSRKKVHCGLRERNNSAVTRRCREVIFHTPTNMMRLLDLDRRPLVCRLCGRITLPEAQRGSIDAHVLHLLKRHRKLAALWALLLDVTRASQSVRRVFVKTIAYIFRRQQQHQRTRTFEATNAVRAISIASAPVEKCLLLCSSHHREAPSTRRRGTMSSAAYSAERVQTEALRRLLYPSPARSVAVLLRVIYGALLLQNLTALRVRQLLQLLRQLTKFRRIPSVSTLQEMQRLFPAVEHLCEKVIAAKPLASLALFPCLLPLQMDGTVPRVLFSEEQRETGSTLGSCLLPGAGQQQGHASEEAFSQQVICWTPRSFLKCLELGRSSESHEQLHRLLEMRHVNARSPFGPVCPAPLLLFSDTPFSTGAQKHLPAFLESGWPRTNPRKPAKCAGDTRERCGLVLQAAGPCNEEFEVLGATGRSNMQREPAARALSKSIPARLHAVGESGARSRMANATGVCNTTSCRTAKGKREGSMTTEGALDTLLPPSNLGAMPPVFSNAAAPADATTLLFPIIPLDTGSPGPTQPMRDGAEVLPMLLRSFSSLAAPSQCARQYLLHYVLTLASSRFLIPCVLRSIFDRKSDRCRGCDRPSCGAEQRPVVKIPEMSRRCIISVSGLLDANPGATAAVESTDSVPTATTELTERTIAHWPKSRAARSQSVSHGSTSCSKRAVFQRSASNESIDRTAATRSNAGGRSDLKASRAVFPSGSTSAYSLSGPSYADLSSTGSCVSFLSSSKTAFLGRQSLFLGASNAHATVGTNSSTLKEGQSSLAGYSFAAEACPTEQAGMSPSATGCCSWDHVCDRAAQQPSTELARVRSCLQGAETIGYDRTRSHGTRRGVQSAKTLFAPVHSAALQADGSYDKCWQNAQQNVGGDKVACSMQEGMPTALRADHGMVSGVVGCLRPASSGRECLSSGDRITRYSWYEAYSLLPKLPRGRSCGPAVTRQCSRAVRYRRFFRAHDGNIGLPLESISAARSGERRVGGDPDKRRLSGSNVPLRRFHLVVLEPSVPSGAASERAACKRKSSVWCPNESFGGSSMSKRAPAEGVSSATQRQGAVAMRVTEVELTNCRDSDCFHGSAAEEGAQLVNKFSKGHCGVESLLQPVSVCFVSFLVTCTSTLPSARRDEGARCSRITQGTNANPAELHCGASAHYKRAVIARCSAGELLASGSARHGDTTSDAQLGSTAPCSNLCEGKSADNCADVSTPVAPKKSPAFPRLAGFANVRRRLRSTINRRTEGLVSAAMSSATAGGATSSVAREAGCRGAGGDDSELVVSSPPSFLSFVCSYQSEDSRACLFEVPCYTSSSASSWTHSSHCWCPLPATQAAVLTAVLYGQYVSVCAELAVLLLKNWNVGDKKRTARKRLVQLDRGNDRQTSTIGAAQSSDGEHLQEKHCETRAMLLRLVLHQLRCPFAAEIMTRDDHSSLFLMTACTDCKGLLRPLLRKPQLHELLHRGTTELVRADGTTPESAAAFAACAALRGTLDKCINNGGAYNISCEYQAFYPRGLCALLKMIRRLAVLVLSSVLCTLFRFLETQTERELRRRREQEALSRPKTMGDKTTVEVPEEQLYSSRVTVECVPYVTSWFPQSDAESTGDQTHGSRSAPCARRPKKRQEQTKDHLAYRKGPLPAKDGGLETTRGIDRSGGALNALNAKLRQNTSCGIGGNRKPYPDRRQYETKLQSRSQVGSTTFANKHRELHEETDPPADKVTLGLHRDVQDTVDRYSVMGEARSVQTLSRGRTEVKRTREQLLNAHKAKPRGNAKGCQWSSTGRQRCDASCEEEGTKLHSRSLCCGKQPSLESPPEDKRTCADNAATEKSRGVHRVDSVVANSTANAERKSKSVIIRDTRACPEDISGDARISDFATFFSTSCVASEVCGTEGATAPPSLLSTGQAELCTRGRNIHIDGNVETSGTCSAVGPGCLLPSASPGTREHTGEVAALAAVLSTRTCEAGAGKRIRQPVADLKNQSNQVETSHCILANVLVPECPTAHQECVKFGGSVRLCDDVKTGLHLQVTPFLAHIRRGVPLFIRHQLQRSGMRQSVLVDSFSSAGSTRGHRGPLPLVNTFPLVRTRAKVSAGSDSCKCSVQFGSSVSRATMAATSIPVTGNTTREHQKGSTTDRHASGHMSWRGRSPVKHCASAENAVAGRSDTIYRTLNSTGSGEPKREQQLLLEKGRQAGADSNNQSFGTANEGTDVRDVVLERREISSAAVTTTRTADLLDRSRIDLFAWNLFLENGIDLSGSQSPSTSDAKVCKDGEWQHTIFSSILGGSSSTDVKFRSRESVMQAFDSVTAGGLSPRQGRTTRALASQSSMDRVVDKMRSNSADVKEQAKPQPEQERSGRDTDKMINIRKEKWQHSRAIPRWDECEEEIQLPKQATPRCQSRWLDTASLADDLAFVQRDTLLPTDGTSHSRLLAANWQAADRITLALPTQEMQERNVSAFHGLVISEDGLLPENARLQLRRNELFFAVNQRERNARTAALLEGTSARLGVKIPSFLARTKILKLKKSNVHGWGVFAGEPIYRDEFIVEYSSSMVNDALANFREWQYMQSLGGKTYFFKLKNSCIVDATHSGGVTRFINHSCTPNCRTQDVSNEGVDEAGARCHLGLYALRDIAVGEELFYDYRQVDLIHVRAGYILSLPRALPSNSMQPLKSWVVNGCSLARCYTQRLFLRFHGTISTICLIAIFLNLCHLPLRQAGVSHFSELAKPQHLQRTALWLHARRCVAYGR